MTAWWLLPAAYGLGSLPVGLWVVRIARGVDIREVGSGNIGTTNVYRAAGLGFALLVFVLDALKGLAPVAVARAWQAPAPWVALIALAAVVGHSKSIFLRFKGGKSAATGVGTILGLSWPAGAATLAAWALLFGLSRRVSLGSLGAALAVPLLLWAFRAPGAYVLYGIVAALYVILRHRANISRLLRGEETRL